VKPDTPQPSHPRLPQAIEQSLEEVVRPALRGWLHEKTFLVAVPAAILLVIVANGAAATISAAVYGVGFCALYGVSGSYHRRNWTPEVRKRMQRLDHGTIFVMIAGTYTPLCVLVLHGWVRVVFLTAVWVGALGGLVLAITDVARKRWIGSVFYIALGWAAVLALPQLARGLTTTQLLLVLVGGILYTVGAVVLATQWPDPRPATFGYHEVWHVFVVVASICHYVVIWQVVRAA
jgi:hemolysin III